MSTRGLAYKNPSKRVGLVQYRHHHHHHHHLAMI